MEAVRYLLNIGIIVLMLQYFVANSDPSIMVSVFHRYHLHFQGAFVSGYGISSHVTVYFSPGWFEIFSYLSFGGCNKDRF